MELHDHGLASDLEMMRRVAGRRRVVRWLLTGATALPLISCGGGTDTGSMAAGSAGTVTLPATGACTVIPEETGGPCPADGTSLQMATVNGNATAGYVVTLTIAVNG